MHPSIFLLPLVPLVLVSLPPRGLPHSPEKEPPLRFSVRFDGVDYDAVEGEAFEVTVGEAKVAARVAVKPTRLLDVAGIAFEYPLSMGFEYSGEDYLRTWTLDGNDCCIILNRFPPELDFEVIERAALDGALAALGQQDVEPAATEVRLGAEKVAARRWKVELPHLTQVWIIVRLAGERDSVLLWLQDSIGEDGGHSAEGKAVLDLLARTFRRTSG